MSQMLGAFEQAVLLAILRLREDAYGRAILKVVQARLERDVPAGAVHATLERLAKKGWVTAKWGQTDANQRARFYRITPEGKRQLLREESRWTELVNAITQVMKAAPTPGTQE